MNDFEEVNKLIFEQFEDLENKTIEAVKRVVNSISESSEEEIKSLTTEPPLVLGENERPAKRMKKDLLLYLREREKAIIEELKKIYSSDKLSQIKSFQGLWDRLLSTIKSVFGGGELKTIVEDFTRKFYLKGMEASEVAFAQNFFPDQNAIDFLKSYNFDLIKNMTEETANKLKSALQRSFMNNLPFEQVKEEVKKIFDSTEARAKAIVVTEQNRAANIGMLDGARQSNVSKGKTIVNYDPVSEVCKRLIKKYGGKVIPLDEKFVDSVTGQSWMAPPFHVNCKTQLRTPRIKGG